ncbi:MAG: SAM-dependent methyltransferase [Acidimicrobiales bacterium]
MSDPAPFLLHQHLVDRIHRHGPLRFSTVMDAALYDPEHGFFTATGGSAGRRGDFLTSPEVGPLFGAVLARAIDTWWDELGRPDPFVVVDAGAGPGTLAVAVLAASPRCASALHYVLVERSPVLREHHGDHLPLAPPATSLGVPGAGDGPVVVSLAELPATELVGVILANELLDNLAVDLLIRTDDGWGEIRIGVDDVSGGGQLVHHVVPAAEPAVSAAQRFAPDAPVGATIPWQRQAGDWVRDGLALLSAGRLVVIDYAVDTTAELARRPMHEWLRTYRGHDRAGDPLDTVGTADITVEVCIDQLAWAAGEPTSVRRQGEFLRAHGIDELVAEGRRVWDERAHLGDLAAIRGRSRITEADALLDRDGLGAFRVVEWTKA